MEKIEFFARCQKLLLAHHPSSPFLLTQENYAARKSHALDFIRKYKGYVYADDRICILFNKIRIDDPRNPNQALKDNLFGEPRPLDYNAISVDFVVFKALEDCAEFCKSQHSPQIAYILFVRHGEVKLHAADKLLASLNGARSGV